jgi:hypothetical protein
MKLVYVAGPYRGKSTWKIDRNINAAREWGMLVALCGAYPVIPHSNTAHFDGTLDDKFWLDGTLELLSRCDGSIFIPGWIASSGSRGEWALAERLNIPALDLEEVPHASYQPTLSAWIAGIKKAK